MFLHDCNGDRVEELERSLASMKEQQVLLKEQLRQESERKKVLQAELDQDHKRIAELERLLDGRRTKIVEDQVSEGVAIDADVAAVLASQDRGSNAESQREHKWRWLAAEEERLVELRTAIQCQSQELDERQTILEKREKQLERSLRNDASVERPASTQEAADVVEGPLPTAASDVSPSLPYIN